MSSFESGKRSAGIGSILLVLSPIPIVGWILGIVGAILLLGGIKELANYYQNQEIYQSALTGVVYYIIALIAFGVAAAALVIGAASVFGLGFGIIALILGWLIAFVFYLLAAMQLRKSFDLLSQRSGEGSFATAGTLLFWGAILTIIFIGVILLFIAWIFAAIAFFSVRAQQQQPQPYTQQPYGYAQPTPPPTQPTVPPTQTIRYCPYCGAQVAQDAAYCPRCGRQLPPY